MSGVLCIWADLPDDATAWYESEYIPDMCSRNAVHVLHCNEKTISGMEGSPMGQLDSPWDILTVYEVSDTRKATENCYDKRNHPDEKLLAGSLKDARFDLRTYREVKRWQKEDWQGDVADIASVAAMEWRIAPDMVDEVLDFYLSTVAPTLFSSPNVLRFRLLEIDNATVLQGKSYITKDKSSLHPYFTLIELESEEAPWEAVIELGKIEKWKAYFETPSVVKWQVSHYLLDEAYTSDAKAKELNADDNTE